MSRTNPLEEADISILKRSGAEFIGTFWLVFGGCGSAVIAAAFPAVLWVIASGKSGFTSLAGFAANGCGKHSPGGYSPFAALVCEVVMTFFFLLVIIGSTDTHAPRGLAPIAVGLCLTLIHLVSIPVTNTSVNPARRR